MTDEEIKAILEKMNQLTYGDASYAWHYFAANMRVQLERSKTISVESMFNTLESATKQLTRKNTSEVR